MDFVADFLYAAKEHWIILTLVLLAILVYWHYVVNFTYLKDIGLRGPTPLPLVGNFLNFFLYARNLHERQREDQRAYGRIYGLYLLKTPTIVVSDPEILKVVLVKEFEKFHDRPVSRFCFHISRNSPFDISPGHLLGHNAPELNFYLFPFFFKLFLNTYFNVM